jgi:hypothetical protein
MVRAAERVCSVPSRETMASAARLNTASVPRPLAGSGSTRSLSSKLTLPRLACSSRRALTVFW